MRAILYLTWSLKTMNRTQLASCGLLASAFILAGMLVANLDDRDNSKAYGDQVVDHGEFTFMTARTKSDDESLFVIDNINAKLLILKTDVSRRKIEVVQAHDLSEMFRQPGRSRR